MLMLTKGKKRPRMLAMQSQFAVTKRAEVTTVTQMLTKRMTEAWGLPHSVVVAWRVALHKAIRGIAADNPQPCKLFEPYNPQCTLDSEFIPHCSYYLRACNRFLSKQCTILPPMLVQSLLREPLSRWGGSALRLDFVRSMPSFLFGFPSGLSTYLNIHQRQFLAFKKVRAWHVLNSGSTVCNT